MQIYNPTVLKVLPYESVGPQKERYQTIALKGTFKIIPGKVLRLIEDSEKIEDLIFADEYYGEPNMSSIKRPNDLAYFKPNTDIFVSGIARSKENERCCKKSLLNEDKPVVAPQILGIGEEVPELGKTVAPKGFGAITPSWDQRLQHGGTYDQDWIDTQHPLPPHDFKYDFFNAAHPDLIYSGYLQGGEKVSLDGFLVKGNLDFELPEADIQVEVIFQNLSGYNVKANLDTLFIDVESMMAYLTWRVFLPITESTYGLNIAINIMNHE